MSDQETKVYSDAIKELGDKIVAMTLKEAKELSDYLKDVHGIEPATGGAVMVAGPAAGGDAPAAEEKTEFDVILDSFGESKLNIIKVVKAATGLSLGDAKALVDGCPKPVKTGIAKDDAEKLKADLEAAGAKVSLK